METLRHSDVEPHDESSSSTSSFDRLLEEVATYIANSCLAESDTDSTACSTSNVSRCEDALGSSIRTQGDLLNSLPVPKPLTYPTPIDMGTVLEGNNVGNFGGNYFAGLNCLQQIESGKGIFSPALGRVPCFSFNRQFSYTNAVRGLPQGYELVGLANSPAGSATLLVELDKESRHFTWDLMSGLADSRCGIPFVFHVMTNEFGARVYAKLIKSYNLQNFKMGPIVYMITNHHGWFIKLAKNKYGSNSIKQVVKVVNKSPEVNMIMRNLIDGFNSLMTDPSGSHLVLDCLNILEKKQRKLLYEAAVKNCLSVATNEHGHISLTSLIEKIQGPHRDMLLNLVSQNASFLSQDPCGNFVVQKVLSLDHPAYTNKICSGLRGRYLILALMKWGSHVVEKCLSSRAMVRVVEDICSSRPDQLRRAATDQYGNYVIQTALKVAKEKEYPLYRKLVLQLARHVNDLRNGYGKNIYRMIVSDITQH